MYCCLDRTRPGNVHFWLFLCSGARRMRVGARFTGTPDCNDRIYVRYGTGTGSPHVVNICGDHSKWRGWDYITGVVTNIVSFLFAFLKPFFLKKVHRPSGATFRLLAFKFRNQLAWQVVGQRTRHLEKGLSWRGRDTQRNCIRPPD